MTFHLFFCFPQVSWQIVSIPTSHLLFFLQWLFLQQQHYFLFLFATENQHSLRPFTVLILKNFSTGQREKQASNNHFWIKTKNYHLETIIIIIILQLFFSCKEICLALVVGHIHNKHTGSPRNWSNWNWNCWTSGSAPDMICWLLYRQQYFLPLFPMCTLGNLSGYRALFLSLSSYQMY